MSTRFPRIQNPDGTFNSMCTACFKTIARNRQETELEEVEDAHYCQHERVRQFMPGNRELA